MQNETSLAHIHHHVTGVLNHGMDKAHIFTWTDEFPSDCNITLNCLMNVLDDTAKVISIGIFKQGKGIDPTKSSY